MIVAAVQTWKVLANVRFAHSWFPGAENSVVGGGWSIGDEMSFYLLVPLIIFLIRGPTFCISAFWHIHRVMRMVDPRLCQSYCSLAGFLSGAEGVDVLHAAISVSRIRRRRCRVLSPRLDCRKCGEAKEFDRLRRACFDCGADRVGNLAASQHFAHLPRQHHLRSVA